MNSTNQGVSIYSEFQQNNSSATPKNGWTLLKRGVSHTRYVVANSPHLWISLPVSLTLLGIGGAGLLDMIIPDVYMHLSWKEYNIWPLFYLESWPFCLVSFLSGFLLFLDALGIPRKLWQRNAIWWLVFFTLWQVAIYGLVAMFGPIQIVGTAIAYLGLALSYTLVLLFGPPLGILARNGEIKSVD